MDLFAVRDHIQETCEFPVDHDTLIAAVGDIEIDAPDNRSVTLETVLSRTSDDNYHSIETLYRTVKGNLGAAFVGPRHYDDRAGARSTPSDRHPTTSPQQGSENY